VLPPVAPAGRAGEETVRRASAAPDALVGHAMVVDDEPMVRDVARRVLEPRGWIVSLAQDGSAALEGIASSPTVDVVLLDVTMPGQNGHDVLRRLRHTRPDLPVVMMSGYSDEVAVVGGDALQPDGFVRKPFTGKSLAQALDAALAKRRARSPALES
jgi:CheY-like chemotaxis protein